MGIEAAPTCVMSFEDATGWLVGEPHRGLACMFTMMNHERLAVGIQGLGIAEKAYQSAVAYARERLQGRSLSGPKRPDLPADPIIVHPDVRRLLHTTRAWNEGARALAGWVGLEIDRSIRHPDPAVRRKAADRVGLLTPVVKAFLSDLGYENATRCQQVFGGAGYIAETGMEQLVRDARIAQIYEGTNGVQANDLVGRKIFMNGGETLRELAAELRAFIVEREDDEALAEFLGPFAAALERLEVVTQWLLERAAENREELGAAAVDYLRFTGLVCLAYLWTSMAEAALERAPSDNSGFYRAKLATARYFMGRLLPETATLDAAIRSGRRPSWPSRRTPTRQRFGTAPEVRSRLAPFAPPQRSVLDQDPRNCLRWSVGRPRPPRRLDRRRGGVRSTLPLRHAHRQRGRLVRDGLALRALRGKGAHPPEMRLLLMTGLLGAFTTFSTFSVETLALLQAGRWLAAATNVLLSVGLCLCAAGLGMLLGR